MTVESGYLPLPVSQSPAGSTRNGHAEFMPLQPQPTTQRQSTGEFVSDDRAVETLCSIMSKHNRAVD